MAAALAVYVWCSILVVSLVTLLISGKGLHKRSVPIRRDEGRRGGTVHRVASWIVLGLGHITFAVLHAFEHLGVDMAREDAIIASWTDWSEEIKADLAAALADAQTLRDTDAAEDAAQANAQSEALADKLQAAFDKVTAGPVVEEPIPGPPETPPSGDVPVTDVPVVTPDPEAPVVADPETDSQ